MDFKQKVEQVINEIRPHLQADGGDIELVQADESNGQVTVRLAGHCRHCPMASLTLQKLVEKNLKEKVKEVTEVINVTI
jgi:Fe-S cluster biogenesis protein NfuA